MTPSFSVRLERPNHSGIKTIGIDSDGLITVESWRVMQSQPLKDLKRRTTGSDVYAPKPPIEAFCETITTESAGYEIQTVLQGRDISSRAGANWINQSYLSNVEKISEVKAMLAGNDSLYGDLIFLWVGETLMVFNYKSGGAVWITATLFNASFDSGSDHVTMTFVCLLSMMVKNTTMAIAKDGRELDLRKLIDAQSLPVTLQDLGASAKLFAMPMRFSRQKTALW